MLLVPALVIGWFVPVIALFGAGAGPLTGIGILFFSCG
jgi:hypothetical protein